MDHSQNIITFMAVRASMQGAAGWVMWFLVGLSVVSLTIVVERLVYLTLHRCHIERVQAALQQLMFSGQLAEARRLLAGQRGLAAKVVLTGAEAMDQGREAVAELMAGAVQAGRVRQERGLAVLATLGNNAPFVGLFGTVLEIIRSLHMLSEKTGVGAGAVMSSLSEALAATAIGLMVALPAVAANNYFQRRIRITVTEAEALARVLLAHLSSTQGRAQSTAAVPVTPTRAPQTRSPQPIPQRQATALARS